MIPKLGFLRGLTFKEKRMWLWSTKLVYHPSVLNGTLKSQFSLNKYKLDLHSDCGKVILALGKR